LSEMGRLRVRGLREAGAGSCDLWGFDHAAFRPNPEVPLRPWRWRFSASL